MAPLVLEGETLGKKHRHFNKLVNEAIKAKETIKQNKINFEEPDIDNLYKIDIASHVRDIEFILDVLTCEDMLYVSRAIKQSKWLITESQYAHIINPKYLHDILFPQMMTKSKNKFMLQIRLNLKDEKRVEEFFNYLKHVDLKVALKWLPNCSVSFIKQIMEEGDPQSIPIPLLKRLCEKSVTFLDVYCKKNENYSKCKALSATIFLIHTDMNKYMDIVESCNIYDVPSFGPESTKIIMKKCPQRILDNLERYVDNIDIPTFANFIKEEELKDFILKNKNDKKLYSLFKFDNMQHFLKRIPVDNRFDFVKEVFINKTNKDDERGEEECYEAYADSVKCSALVGFSGNINSATSSNIYQWYKFAPFNVALIELKKLIRIESHPSERIAILAVLLHCAGNNIKHIKTLIQYYWKNHINEPFKFKIQFVNNLISKTNTHEYDEDTWGHLNDLFTSMEVYEENNNNVQSCIKAIILYCVVHNKNIPKVIEKKFEFDTLKSSQKKLNSTEKEKVFNYLRDFLITKIEELKTTEERDFTKAITFLENFLRLLMDWKRDLRHFPLIIKKIKDLVEIKRNRSWDDELSHFYNINKAWRIHFFNESIVLNPTEEACINALKHDVQLLHVYKKEVEIIYLNDAVTLKNFLTKLRIYWPQTLSEHLKTIYFDRIEQKINHKAVVIGLCVLLPLKNVLPLVHKYAPSETKIDWSQHNETELSLQKNIAKRLHLVRPQPSLATALLYAKGDYLQYTLPSLNAILYNMNSSQAREQIKNLLDAPVSLQKHGIRTVLTKLKSSEIKNIFNDMWNSTKNSSIRADIFNQTFKLLCKENDTVSAQEIWKLMSMFLDRLTTEENKTIYVTLSKASKVPLPIRVPFWVKSYKFLKSLPEKANCSFLCQNLKRNMTDIMEFLDVEDASEIFLESFNKTYTNERYDDSHYLPIYLLSCRDEETQNIRYEKILLPILEKSFTSWNEQIKNVYCTRNKVNEIIKNISWKISRYVVKDKMILPITMMNKIFEKLKASLPIQENYILLTNLKMTLTYIKHLDIILKQENTDVIECDSKDKNNVIFSKINPALAKDYFEYLKSDVRDFFPGIYLLFADALEQLFHDFDGNDANKLNTLQVFVENEDFIEGYLMALKILPSYLNDADKALKLEILNKISVHPSQEVKMHYWRYVETTNMYL